eukprot:6407748-Prymnesium_polylepis.1
MHPQSLELVEWRSFITWESRGGSKQMAVNGVNSTCPVCPTVNGTEVCGTSDTGRCAFAFAAYVNNLTAAFPEHWVLLIGTGWEHWSNQLGEVGWDALRGVLGAQTGRVSYWNNGPSYALITRVGSPTPLAEVLAPLSSRFSAVAEDNYVPCAYPPAAPPSPPAPPLPPTLPPSTPPTPAATLAT